MLKNLEFIKSLFHQHYPWLLQVVGIVLCAYILHAIAQKLFKKLSKRTSSSSVIGNAIIKSAGRPIKLLIIAISTHAVLSVINEQFVITAIRDAIKFLPSIYIVIAGWFVMRLKDRLLPQIASESTMLSASTADSLDKLITVTIVIVAILMILPVLGFSINGLLAFGGVGGIVIGLAAKDFLSNIFGAISLHFDNHFVVGDWIAIADKNLEGIVEEIGWKKVTIRTFDKRQVYIPNAMFANFIIENPSRMTHRRINESLLLEAKSINALQNVIGEIEAYLKSNPNVDATAGVVVRFNGFSQSVPTLLISAYVKQTAWADYLLVREEILLRIHNILSLSDICLYTPYHHQSHVV